MEGKPSLLFFFGVEHGKGVTTLQAMRLEHEKALEKARLHFELNQPGKLSAGDEKKLAEYMQIKGPIEQWEVKHKYKPSTAKALFDSLVGKAEALPPKNAVRKT